MTDRMKAVEACALLRDLLQAAQEGRPVNRAAWNRGGNAWAFLRDYVKRHRFPVWHPRRWYTELFPLLPSRWRMRWPLPVVLVLALAGCRAPGAAVRTLEGAGYSSVKLTGSAVGCCPDRPLGDSFEAIGPDGRAVRGCVCRYLWGGAVIRIK